MPGQDVYIVTEIHIDYTEIVGVYSREWAMVLANRLEFAGCDGDVAYFNVKGNGYSIKMQRMILDA